MKTITIETPTGSHHFTGRDITVNPSGGTLRITVDGAHVASFRTWESWVITTEKDTK